MSLRFGPDDHEAFEAARDGIVADFEAVGGRRFAPIAEQVLDLKWNYLDGDLGRWSADDVTEILFGVFPAKVMLDSAQIAEVPAGFAALLRFLARDHPNHDPPLDSLARLVEQSALRFQAAMNDDDNWSFGKRMWSTAVAEGVDLSDREELDRWVEQFNARSLAERDQILGPMPARARGAASAGLAPLPPVVLAPESELRAAAAEAVVVQRLGLLVEFVGAGRAVTDLGNLKLADGKALVGLLATGDRFDERFDDHVFKTKSSEHLPTLDYTYRLALGAGLLAVRGRKVVPGRNARWATDAPLDLAYGAFLVMMREVGPTAHHFRGHRYGFDWFAETLDDWLPTMLLTLYRDPGLYEINELVADAWEELEATFELQRLSPEQQHSEIESVDFALRRALDRFVEVGILAVADEIVTPRAYGGGNDRSDGIVLLTPLGIWAVQRMASRIIDAPVVGALRGASAADLLRATADLPPDTARVEIDTWIADRGERAAGDLCAAIRVVGETARGLAFRALLRIGVSAADAVSGLADDPELAPFVTVWRVDTLSAHAEAMDRAGDPEGWVRLVHTVIELWGPQAAVAAWAVPAAGTPGIDAMLNAAWRVPGQRTADVLAAVGGHHPDKHIAKAARKALFKYRSSG